MIVNTYIPPQSELIEILFEEHLLDGSVGSVTGPGTVGDWGSNTEEDW